MSNTRTIQLTDLFQSDREQDYVSDLVYDALATHLELPESQEITSYVYTITANVDYTVESAA